MESKAADGKLNALHGMDEAGARAFQLDLKKFEPFVKSDGSHFLCWLTPRGGSKPDTSFCLPHMQITDTPSKEVWTLLFKKLFATETFPDSNPTPQRSAVSAPESEAMVMLPDRPMAVSMPNREWGHLHGAHDGSLHALFSPSDAKKLIETGWGESHLLAGKPFRGNTNPIGIMMVFAPRTEEEVDIVGRIMSASYKFAHGDKLEGCDCKL